MKMYPLSPVSVLLLLSYGGLAFSSPLPHGQGSGKDSLESTPGPYKFKPAPVWRREADAPGEGSNPLESTPGPYKFEPAPVSKREADPPGQRSNSLESTPGPYKFKPAPVGKKAHDSSA